jgi:type I restriction enzyme S subunit
MGSNGWKEVTLNDVAYLNYGKSLTADARKKGPIPVYSSSGITGFHNRALVDEEGIIIGRKGNVGSIFYSNQPFYCIDTAYYIKKSELKCDIRYLYYLLKTLRLDRLNEDSAVPGLNRDTAH